MTSTAVFDHEGPWTEGAYLAIRHDGRVEVVDGTLLIGPGAGRQRTRVIERVRAAVAEALPAGLRVRGPVPIRLGPDCVLVPDLVVTAAPAPEPAAADGEEAGAEPTDEDGGEPAGGGGGADVGADAGRPAGEEAAGEHGDDAVLDAGAVLMVIEVVGCDHGAADRSFKPQLYARSRIPYSVLIDHDGPFAVADMIIGGRYHEYARAGGDETMLVEEPFRLELDLAALTAPEPAAARPEPPAEPAAEAPPARALPVVP